jgi:hypothetical protein
MRCRAAFKAGYLPERVQDDASVTHDRLARMRHGKSDCLSAA